MKNSLFAGALLLCSGAIGTTQAMELSEKTKTDSTTSTPVSIFSVRDVCSKIIQYLFETRDFPGALTAFKAFCCTNQACYYFFKNSEETTLSFAFYLLKTSFSNGETLENVFSPLVSNLNPEGVNLFKAKLDLGRELASICKRSEWNSLLEMLTLFLDQASL